MNQCVRHTTNHVILLSTLCLMSSTLSMALATETCSYSSYRWDTTIKKAVDVVTVNKRYEDLLVEEIDARTGCTVCIEDQRWIQVGKLQPVRLCKVIAHEVESILNRVVANGFKITELEGYRVGRTRGDVDLHGKRTEFSNHSFGIAIDVNSSSNGLYENCLQFDQKCVLRRGGDWQPGINPQSIATQGTLVQQMKGSGFKWGGEIIGRQKDFMHFSVSGY